METINTELYNQGEIKEDFQKEEAYLRAKQKLDNLVGFYWHLAVFVIVNPFLIFINYTTYWGFKWFWFSFFGWGLAIVIHAFTVFGPDLLFGKKWEDDKIKQFMDKEKRNNFK